MLQRLTQLRVAVSKFTEEPHVFDGNYCLVGKSFHQLDLRQGKMARLSATCVQRSNKFPRLTKRNNQESAKEARSPHWHIVLRTRIGNVKRAMLAHPTKLWLINTDFNATDGYETEMSPRNHSVSLVEPQRHVIDPTNASSALHNSVEHRLHFRRRAADDAEHLGLAV